MIGGAMAVLALVAATLPMRLVLTWAGAEQTGFAAQAVTGSVWAAKADDARLGPLSLGDLDIRLRPIPLLAGRAEIEFRRAGDGQDGVSGRLVSGTLHGMTDASGRLPIFQGLGMMPVDAVRLDGVEALFDDKGHCKSAHGGIGLTIGGSIAGLDLTQGLSGKLACRGTRAKAELLSQSGMESLSVSFDGMGRYDARFMVRVDRDPVMAAALAALGLRPTEGGFAIALSGQF